MPVRGGGGPAGSEGEPGTPPGVAGGLCPPGAGAPGAGPALLLLLREGPGEARGDPAGTRGGGGGTAGPLCYGPAVLGSLFVFSPLSFLLPRRKI